MTTKHESNTYLLGLVGCPTALKYQELNVCIGDGHERQEPCRGSCGYPDHREASQFNFTRARRRADAKELLDGVQSRGLQLSPDVRRWLLEATGY